MIIFYSAFSSASVVLALFSIKFTKIPKIKAHAIEVIWIWPNEITNPPIPVIKIVATTNKFLFAPKSTFWIIFKPLTAINPYNATQTPPITNEGIVLTKATNGDKNEMIIARIAAVKIVATDAFLVIATHATLSPYVVLGHPPTSAPAIEPTPSPSNVLWRPGSSSKSFPIIDEIFLWSATCSVNTTSATGTYATATATK